MEGGLGVSPRYNFLLLSGGDREVAGSCKGVFHQPANPVRGDLNEAGVRTWCRSSSLSFYFQMRHFRNSKGIDLPGHPAGKPCTTIEGYVEWVRGFIAARRYKDVVLCGHSMGGGITQLYALTYPEELQGIILIGTGARLRVHPKYLQEAEEAQTDSTRWLENSKQL